MKTYSGFTLIEILVAITIVGILAAIAVPNFTDQLQKSRRSEAITALLDVQQAQARLRANCRWYGQTKATANSCEATAAATEVDVPADTDLEYYTITLSNASGNSYTVTATAKSSGSQWHDTDCREIILEVDNTSPNGNRTAKKSDASDNDSCW